MSWMGSSAARRAVFVSAVSAAVFAGLTLTAAAYAQGGTPAPAGGQVSVGPTVRVVLQNGHVLSGILVPQETATAELLVLEVESAQGRGRVAIPRAQVLTILEIPADREKEWRVLLDQVRAERARPPEESTQPTPTESTPIETTPTETTPAETVRPPHPLSAPLARFAALPVERRVREGLPPAPEIVAALPALRQEDLPHAVAALQFLAERRTVQPLQDLLVPEIDAPARLAAARVLISLAAGPQEYLLTLDDPSPDVKLVGLDRLISEGQAEYFGDVAKLLKDIAPQVRSRAARGLVDLGRQLNQEELASTAAADALAETANPDARTGIISVLQDLDQASGAEALYEVVQQGAAEEQRAAMGALRQMKTPGRLDVLRRILGDLSASDRLDLIGEALGAVKAARDLEAVPFLIPYVDHANVSVQAAAQDVLVEVTGIREQGLTSNDWWRRWDAIREGMNR